MGQGPDEQVPSQTVVPFLRVPGKAPVPDGTLWLAASLVIFNTDPALHSAWCSELTEISCEGNCLTLAAPSQFVSSYLRTHLSGRLLAAVTSIDPSVTRISISSGD